MIKLIFIFILIHLSPDLATCQQTVDCFNGGYKGWILNRELKNTKQLRSIDLTSDNTKILTQHTIDTSGTYQLFISNSDSALSCFGHSPNRIFFQLTDTGLIKSIFLEFSFDERLYNLIFDSFKNKDVRIVVWGLDPSAEGAPQDFSAIFKQFSVVLQVHREDGQEKLITLLIKSIKSPITN